MPAERGVDRISKHNIHTTHVRSGNQGEREDTCLLPFSPLLHAGGTSLSLKPTQERNKGPPKIEFMEVRVDLELSLGGSRKGIQDQQILGSFLVKERR